MSKCAIIIVLLLVVSCGKANLDSTGSSSSGGGSSATGSGDDATIEGTGLSGADEVSGEVITVAGTTIAGATVYIPGVTATAGSGGATRTFTQALTATDGTVCEDAPAADEALVVTCTAADGSFVLDTSGLTTNPTQVVIQKGSLRIIVPLACSENICVIDSSFTTVGSSNAVTVWPKVAVVTGDLDRMEDVLAKMADDDTSDSTNGDYGRVSSSDGAFVYGSEDGTNLTIIDGNGATTSEENGLTYKNWDKYLDGTYALLEDGSPVFDIIFINCGNAYESSVVTNKTALQNYVNAGGRLFVTDQAYDFIEQPFPYVIKFEGDPDSATTAGTLGAAENGVGGEQYDVLINSSGMKTWLGSVTSNRHNSSTPGNPDVDCSDTGTQDVLTTALLGSGLMPLGGLLNKWAHMTGAHSDYSPTIWISSGSTTMDGLTNRPLTISMSIGSSGGKVVYSSYHTAYTCTSTTFWPQERALEFLILESF